MQDNRSDVKDAILEGFIKRFGRGGKDTDRLLELLYQIVRPVYGDAFSDGYLSPYGFKGRCPDCGDSLEKRHYVDARDGDSNPTDEYDDWYCKRCDARWEKILDPAEVAVPL